MTAQPIFAEAVEGDYSFTTLTHEELRAAVGIGDLTAYDDQLEDFLMEAQYEVYDAMGVAPVAVERTDAYERMEDLARLSMYADTTVDPVVTVDGTTIDSARVAFRGPLRVAIDGDVPNGRATIVYTTALKDGADVMVKAAVRRLVAWFWRDQGGESLGNRPIPRPDIESMVRPYGLPSGAEIIR